MHLFPSLYDAHVTLLHLLVQSRHSAEAEQAVREALSRFPNSPVLWSYLGEILATSRRVVDAEVAYREALRLDGSRPMSWVGIGMALRVQKRIDEAVAANENALELDQDCADAVFGLALCCIEKRSFREAIQYFRRAIALKPEFPPAHYFLGKTLAQAPAAFDEAISELRIARQQGYTEGKVALELSKVYSRHGYIEDALAELGRAIAAGVETRRAANDPAFQNLASSWGNLPIGAFLEYRQNAN